MLHHDIHEKLLAYTDRELELLRANYQLCHKFKSHMERRFFKDNYGNDSNLLIVFYVQIMPDDFVMQLHR
ncbi:hypothetical protein SJ394_28915, partial [Klebsiella pneumoniae]|nr:hypothetical protein [Klebsiella pneumoniae]